MLIMMSKNGKTRIKIMIQFFFFFFFLNHILRAYRCDSCCSANVYSKAATFQIWLHINIATQVEYLWNESHLTPSQSTTPEVIRSSAKYSVSMPSSSCFLNWIPEVVRSSIESCAYISSLMKHTSHIVSISATKGKYLWEHQLIIDNHKQSEFF